MKRIVCCCVLLLLIVRGAALFAADAMPRAVAGQVSGKVQQVGFRAMILREAIALNLSGTAENLKDGTVRFVLQGDGERIERALTVIRKGTARSSDVKVVTEAAPLDAQRKTFTVIGWTSSSRRITDSYNLVFKLRPDNSMVSEEESKRLYHEILESTLSAEDLKKLGEGDDADGS